MYGRSYCCTANPHTSGILLPLLSVCTFLARSTTWSHVRRSFGSVPGTLRPACLNRSRFTKRPTLVEPMGIETVFPLYIVIFRSAGVMSSRFSFV